MAKTIAIIGATTLIGFEIMDMIANHDTLGDSQIIPLTNKRQSGHEISFGEAVLKTKNIDEFDAKTADVVIYAGGLQEPKPVIQSIAKTGVQIIDATGVTFFENYGDNHVRMPSSRSAQLAAILKPLHDLATIKRVVVTTFEPVSGEGKDGMDELFNQSRKFFVTDGLETNVYGKQMAFNILPQVDGVMDDGQTHAEWLMNAELKQLVDSKIKVSASCTHVPVFMGMGMAITIECDGDIDSKSARGAWRESDEDVIIIDGASEMEYVTPADIAGEDAIFISRIRSDATVDNGLSFWCVADNIRANSAKRVVALLA